MSSLTSLVQALAERLRCSHREEDDGTFTLEVEVVPGEPPTLVTVYGESIDDGHAAGTEVLVVRAVGAEEGHVPPEDYLLALPAGSWFARVYLDDEEGEVVVEAALPLASLRPEEACHAVWEVAEMAAECDEEARP